MLSTELVTSIKNINLKLSLQPAAVLIDKEFKDVLEFLGTLQSEKVSIGDEIKDALFKLVISISTKHFIKAVDDRYKEEYQDVGKGKLPNFFSPKNNQGASERNFLIAIPLYPSEDDFFGKGISHDLVVIRNNIINLGPLLIKLLLPKGSIDDKDLPENSDDLASIIKIINVRIHNSTINELELKIYLLIVSLTRVRNSFAKADEISKMKFLEQKIKAHFDCAIVVSEGFMDKARLELANNSDPEKIKSFVNILLECQLVSAEKDILSTNYFLTTQDLEAALSKPLDKIKVVTEDRSIAQEETDDKKEGAQINP